MSYEKPILEHTRAAAADLSAKQYFACKLDSSEKIALCSSQGEYVHGVLQNDPTSGQHATVMALGITKAKAGGTIATGDPVTTNSSGKLVKAETTGDFILGRACDDAVTDDVFPVLITKEGYFRKEYQLLTFHKNLADIADGDLVTGYVPGYAGKIEKLSAVVSKAATTGSKLSTLNCEIGTTDLTGGSLALTSANMTPIGAVVNATAITAANSFSATDAISIEAASTTTFVEGEIDLVLVLSQTVQG